MGVFSIVVAGFNGLPHFGQAVALTDTLCPQSGQGMRVECGGGVSALSFELVGVSCTGTVSCKEQDGHGIASPTRLSGASRGSPHFEHLKYIIDPPFQIRGTRSLKDRYSFEI